MVICRGGKAEFFMKKHRLLSWILTVVMLFQCVVVTGSAADNSGITKITMDSLRYVNPHYADLVDLDELLDEVQSASVWSTESTTVYNDYDQVVEAVQNALFARETTFTISVDVSGEGLMRLDESDAAYAEEQARLREFCTDLFVSQPLAHDVNTPKGGDYLQFTLAGYDVPQDLWVSDERALQRIDAHYSVAYYTTAEQEAAVDAEVARLVEGWKKMGLGDCSTEEGQYAAASAIYSFICDHVVYDHEGLEDENDFTKYSAYAALIEGTSVCQGYANCSTGWHWKWVWTRVLSVVPVLLPPAAVPMHGISWVLVTSTTILMLHGMRNGMRTDFAMSII